MQIIEVRWIDSTEYPEQVSAREDWEVSTMQTVGYVIEETDDYVVLAQELCGKDVRRVIVIPDVCILERRAWIDTEQT